MTMHTLTVEFTDPDVQVVQVPGGTWFVVGLFDDMVGRLSEAGANPDAGERLACEHRNASVVLVRSDGERCTDVHLWSGLYSLPDLYYARSSTGRVVVADHVRNVISRLPVGERAPGSDELIEHYLGGFAYDRRTFSRSVARVGLGDTVVIDARRGIGSPRIFDRVAITNDRAAAGDVVDRVEASLEQVISRTGSGPDVCVTFSGGVDSTLLASFFDEPSSLVSMTTDSPEWASETEYARVGADLLGRDLTLLEVPERRYPALLEDTVETMASPPAHYVVPMLKPIYDRDEASFVLGEGADSVFGTDRGLRRISGAFAHRLGLAALAAGSRLPGTVGYRSTQVRSYAASYALPTDDPRSASGTSLRYGDGEMLDDIVGAEAVDTLLADHVRYVLDRVDIETPVRKRFHRHNEIIRWRQTMGNIATIDRLMGQPNGKRIVQPYTEAPVIDALLTVPADRRYVKRLAGKWVLKDLLARRVPGYAVNQRKNATGIPFLRYCVDGPLVDIWDRYEVPDFVPQELHGTITTHPSPMTWYALVHAIWDERIGRNQALQPHAAVAGVELELAGA